MFIIERAQPADFASLEVLVEKTFVETWTGLVDDEHIREHMTDGHAKSVVNRFGYETSADILVVRNGCDLIGYAIGSRPEVRVSQPYYKLEKLYIRSSFQRNGIGSKLWDRMMELGKASGANGVTLTHYPLNVRASRFYERLGLKKVDETIYQCGSGEYRDWVLAASWDDLQKTSYAKGVMAE